jgi:hypothetical protein
VPLHGTLRHDVTDELAAYKLAQLPFPGVFYQSDRPTKNALEKKWIDNTRESRQRFRSRITSKDIRPNEIAGADLFVGERRLTA